MFNCTPHTFRRRALLLTVFLPLPVMAGFVQNPSFEASYNDEWPHYNGNGFNVEVWSGASGINNTSGPFHNANTPIPDGTYAGFKQGSGSVTQVIFGLEQDKQYWLQYYYDARVGSLLDLKVKWNDTVIDSVSAVIPSTTGAYRLRSVPFTPTEDTGTLSFESSVTGDSTLLLDGVTIVQRDEGQVIMQNPSFEASGDFPDPGVAVGSIAGWAATGTVGINTTGGPFAGDTAIPDQDHVLFIQRAGSVTQTIKGLIKDKPYTFAMNVRARTGNTPHVLATANGATLVDQKVTGAAYTNVSGGFTADSDTVELVISQTVDDTDQTLLVDNVRLTGQSLLPLPPMIIGPAALELAPNGTGSISVTVSQERLARGECVVILRSKNSGVADFSSPDPDGTVTLTFPGNQPATTLTAELEGFTRGSTAIEIVDNGGNDEVQGTTNVEVVTSFVRNPSFQNTGIPGVNGYGEVSGWTKTGGGSAGINNSNGPFHNSATLIPDRTQAAFLQGTGSLTQTIQGLTPGEHYWLQFHYDVRDCCDGPVLNARASIDNNVIYEALGVTPSPGVPYHFAQAEFTATAETADLAIAAEITTGDGSMSIDGVNIVPRKPGEIVVQNPSFEASGVVSTWPGYVAEAIAGWTFTGGHGLNVDGRGPFTDNGIAGAQDRVLFMQNTASATQTVTGLTAGKKYDLSVLMNARSQNGVGHTPYQIVVDDIILEEDVQDPVGGDSYTQKTVTFEAASDAAVISFRCVPVNPTDDQTLLIDDVRITAAGATGTVALTIAPLAGNSVVLRWPASSPASLVLKSSTTMAAGSWTIVTEPVNVDNGTGQNTVTLPSNGTRRFYQLFQP